MLIPILPRAQSVLRACLLFGILALFAAAPASTAKAGGVLYAAPQASGTGNCFSWSNACSLQLALFKAAAGDQIWVKQGVHYPATAGGVAISFDMKDGVAIYGGFAGDESALEQRDPALHTTILSGDIDQNDTNLDGNFIAETTADLIGANSFHVVTGFNLSDSAVLDGIVINAGKAAGGNTLDRGAGLYFYYSSPVLRNLLIIGNYATHAGGGLCNWFSPTRLENVTILSNQANYGGGIYNVTSQIKFFNGKILHNSSGTWGGGILNDTSQPQFVNVVVSGNTSFAGGGLMNYHSSHAVLTNVTFSGNSASKGGGMLNDYYSNPILTNVVMWGDQAPLKPEIFNTAVTGNVNIPNISHSLIQGSGGSGAGWDTSLGVDAGSNIDIDPLFLDANGADDIFGTLDDNLRVDWFASPVIDAGLDSAIPPEITGDLDGLARLVGVVDTGAYEVQKMLFLPLVTRE